MSNFVEHMGVYTSFYSCESWTILNPIEQKIKNKIEQIGTPLKEWENIQINYGIKTGFNEAFLIDSNTKKELISADPKSAELIRPILRGRDIGRYTYRFSNLWLLYIPWHFPLHQDEIAGASKKAEMEFEKQYPAIYNHLTKYKKQLSSRNKEETGIRYEWYALQRWGAKYKDDFFEQKIMYNDISQRLSFTLVPENVFCVNTVYFIKNNAHIKYLLACLNSPIIDWYYRTLSVQLGEKAVRMFSIYVEKIPIPVINLDQEKEINNLIDSLHKTTLDSDKERLEKEINNSVCNLYGLTEEEYLYILDKYQRL